MAIKIGTTTVIDNSQVFQNITGASGQYDGMHPIDEIVTGSGSGTIDFTKVFGYCAMTAATTFTVANRASGRSSLLVLDTTSTGHAPSWNSDIKWSEDTEPTWSSARYWQVAFVCWDNTIVRAHATSWGS